MSEYDKQQVRKYRRLAERVPELAFPNKKSRINLNTLAKAITLREGKKESLNIADVKECLKITLEELGKFEDWEIIKLIRRYR